MLEVRNLFETNIDLNETDTDKVSLTSSCFHQHDYSRFIFLSGNETLSEEEISVYVREYISGCKIYGVFSNNTQLHTFASTLDSALKDRGLIRRGESLDYSFTDTFENHASLPEDFKDFKAFHISLSTLSKPVNIPSIRVSNGNVSDDQVVSLKRIADVGSFNVEQYLVEHADVNKNIVIRAGARTGKTYTMISRIAYICYTQNVALQKMANRIVMITFLHVIRPLRYIRKGSEIRFL